MNTARIYCLEAGEHHGAKRLVCDRVDARSLAEGKTITLTVTRTGRFHDPRYGEFDITKDMLLSMVKNFDANVYGQRIMLDVAHKPENGAAAVFKRLFVERGNKLRAEVQLTEFGIDAVKNKGFIYVSAEFHDDYTDNEQRAHHGPTLLGAGLTTRPVIKHLDPIQLSESSSGDTPTYFSEKVIRLLSEDISKMKELLKKLAAKLGSLKLAEAIVKQLCEGFEKAATPLADDNVRRELMENFIVQGEMLAKQLADAGSTGDGAIINLSVASPAAGGLDEAAVTKLLDERNAAAIAATKKLAEGKDANLKVFNDAIDGAESLKSLAEDQITLLKSAADMITADMTSEQVTKLAENQIAVGNNMAVQKQLSQVGLPGAAGVVHVTVDETNGVKSLQEGILVGLRGSNSHALGELKLSEKVTGFVDAVLAVFDQQHMPRLLAESKILAGESTGIVDTNLPVGFQRTVIREALSDNRVLELIQTLTDPSATLVTQIPYETRDVSAVNNDGIVYEGQPIPRASIKQEMDMAYIKPMKLAFLISNEVMHFTASSAIDWNAYARNVESNATFMRELIVRRICNELQRSADAYGAAAIADENLAAQLSGAKSIVKTAQFPIVRPHQERDIKGTAIGAAENPIVVELDGVVIPEYDGSNEQAGGTYYRVTNYNLGYIQYVSELGVPVTPEASAGDDFVSYSYATNVDKFDLDDPGTDLELHLNGLIRKISGRQAVMKAD
ncbi:MAG: phage protease, partial [Gammaproteobacteria bacterium]|nr:phage protease [Gammaproteobacteria bacterium]